MQAAMSVAWSRLDRSAIGSFVSQDFRWSAHGERPAEFVTVVFITEQTGNSTEGFFAPCPADRRLARHADGRGL